MAFKNLIRDADLTSLEAHFGFGRNWKSFLSTISSEAILEAERGLLRLFPEGVQGQHFLDIGCGSGLSMLAALRLGATSVHGIDIDPESAEAARTLLGKWAPDEPWSVEVKSVFDLTPQNDGTYDVVYSWGVLHHTGDMWKAIDAAAAVVGQHGRFGVALYRKTPLCGFWTTVKRAYSRSPEALQRLIALMFKTAFLAGIVTTGRNPKSYIVNYKTVRGMSWTHDVHDWLGGFPYQSVEPQEVKDHLAHLGFIIEREFTRPAALQGLFGSHCDEFVARRDLA